MSADLTRNAWLSFAALLTSSGTLLCCVLPAVMVSLGAGAALAGIVGAVPQLIWLSEHKPWVFGSAGALLVCAGAALWNARRLPCPAQRRGEHQVNATAPGNGRRSRRSLLQAEIGQRDVAPAREAPLSR